MPRSIVATILAALAAVFGIGEVVLLCYMAGVTDGITLALNDPGKTFFHIFLLPPAIWIFVHTFPTSLLAQASLWRKCGLATLGVTYVAIAPWLVWEDHWKGICERPHSPADVSKASVRKELIDWHKGKHLELHKVVDSDKFKEDGKKALKEYITKLDEYRKDFCAGKVDYVRFASIREMFSLFLSMWGGFFLSRLFMSFTVYGVVRVRPDPETLTAYLLIITLVSPWLILGAYSQWYLHFGYLEHTSYTTGFVGAFIATIVLLILFVLFATRKQFKAATAAAIAAIPTISVAISLLKPDWLNLVAHIWYNLNTAEVVVIYVAITTLLLVIISLLMPMDSINKQSPNENAMV